MNCLDCNIPCEHSNPVGYCYKEKSGLPNGPWDKGYQPTDEKRKVDCDAKTMEAIFHLTTRGWTCITPDGTDVVKLLSAAKALVEAVERYICPKKGDKYVFRGEVLEKCNELKKLLEK